MVASGGQAQRWESGTMSSRYLLSRIGACVTQQKPTCMAGSCAEGRVHGLLLQNAPVQACHHHGRRCGALAGVVPRQRAWPAPREWFHGRTSQGRVFFGDLQAVVGVCRQAGSDSDPSCCDARPQGSSSSTALSGSCLQGVKDYSSHARPLRCNLLLDPDSCCPPPQHLRIYIRTCVLTYVLHSLQTYLPWLAPRPVLEPCEPPACSASARAFVCINAAAQRASSGGGEDHPSSLSQASLP